MSNVEVCIKCIFSALLLLLLGSRPVVAQEVNDVSRQQPVISDTIAEIVVTADSPQMTKMKRDGSLFSISTQNIGGQSRILGTADAFRYLQMMSGVATNTDYTAGISVQGCEFSHTIVNMDGATLFYPYHLLGIFSTCNADHFPVLSLEKSLHTASFPNRLGGEITVNSHTQVPQQPGLTADVGLISSGLSLALPISSQCGLYLSGRASYLNWLYAPLLKTDKDNYGYEYYDANLTFLYRPNDADRFSLTAFYGGDVLSNKRDINFVDLRVDWSNFAVAASWSHEGAVSHKTTVSVSDFRNFFEVQAPNMSYVIPSNISQISLKEHIDTKLHDRLLLNAGVVIDANRLMNYRNIDHSEPGQSNSYKNVWESRLYAQLEYSINTIFQLSAGAKATYYYIPGYNSFVVDPSLTFRAFMPHDNVLSLHAGIYHQYIHQVGYSDLGLPIDFWIFADDNILPQKAYSTTLTWRTAIKPIDVDVTVELYYKRMLQQMEFYGSVIQSIEAGFDFGKYMLSSHGFNTGIDVMLQKRFGKLSGWVSYSLGFARRIIPGITHTYVPSSKESLHNLSLSLHYKLNEQWSFAANFLYATGQPFTPSHFAYIYNHNIIYEYGAYNSWRLPDYHRMDLSVTYNIPTKPGSLLRHSVNLSLVNVYGNRNVLFEYFSYDKENNTFLYDSNVSLFSFLPSISYRIELGR